MLFVPFPLSVVRQLRKHLSRCKTIPPRSLSEPGYLDCIARGWDQSPIAHVGEAHCTISVGRELSAVLPDLMAKYEVQTPEEALQKIGLFDESGNGLRFPVQIKSGRRTFMVVPSPWYSDSGDVYVVIAKVNVPLWANVRSRLGLPEFPQLPRTKYEPHVTIGYMYADTEKKMRKQIRKPTELPDRRRHSPAAV